MLISIEYDSSWGNSLMYPEGNRKFNSAGDLKSDKNKKETLSLPLDMKEVKEICPAFDYRTVSKDTVIGILSRLIGDVRKLSEIRENPKNNFIVQMEDSITFEECNFQNNNEIMSLDLEYKLRNPTAGAGVIKKDKQFFVESNDFTKKLYSVFDVLPTEVDVSIFLDNLKKGIIPDYIGKISASSLRTLVLKSEENMKVFSTSPDFAKTYFPNCTKIINVYGLMMYEILYYLQKNKMFTIEVDSLFKGKSNITGFAPSSGKFAVAELYVLLTGERNAAKKSPYKFDLYQGYFKKHPELKAKTHTLGIQKHCATIDITVTANQQQEEMIHTALDNAGVSPFYVGKKGLGYIKTIEYKWI